jgi:hypothetical protein
MRFGLLTCAQWAASTNKVMQIGPPPLMQINFVRSRRS